MDLIVREFEKHAVRMIQKDEQTWFMAKDVCEVLGISNSRDAVAALDSDEKLVSEFPTADQIRKANFINESGLYTLVIRSNKPEAKKFRKWVTSEVLPSIRKNGAYISPDATAAGIVAALEKSMEAKYALMMDNARLKSRLEILSMFQPIGKPGDISKNTGAEKWRFRRGFFCSGDKGRPASLLLQHPLQPDMFETFELTT
jgi:prophage antirepressor-like protein